MLAERRALLHPWPSTHTHCRAMNEKRKKGAGKTKEPAAEAKSRKHFGPPARPGAPWLQQGGKPHKTAAHLMGKSRKVH